ncbi:hypothetical protein BFD37_01465 [Escherichia coli]|nr:hypothetical protein ECONIH1_04550 [Escherichia coli]KUG93477.1 hypothetical protein ARC92_20695 [Escherichia coli]KUU76156.1 hypothetical protein AWF30_10805 [Escherichia coli]KUW04056.1 hypothetical protein AWF53_08905 [Escherichia coli]MCH6632433.1 hypothetical protein [Escherichia coli]
MNLHAFVGRIRRLRRIRHFTTSTCQQFENTGKNFSVLPPISHPRRYFSIANCSRNSIKR